MPSGLSNGRDAPWRDEGALYEQYIHQHKSIREIADEWDCNHKTVHRWLKNHGIERRGQGHPAAHPELRDAEKLESLYWGEYLSTAEISDIYDCSRRQISYWLNKHDIEIRPAHGDARKHPATWDELSEDELRSEYIDNGKSLTEIGDKYGVTAHAVRNALFRNGIETREPHPSGSDNPAWNGGSSAYHLIRQGLSEESWPTIRQELIDSYGTACHSCGSDVGGSIQMHHIVPILYGGTNAREMFLPLCRGCHNEVEAFTKSLPEVKPLVEYATDNKQRSTEPSTRD